MMGDSSLINGVESVGLLEHTINTSNGTGGEESNSERSSPSVGAISATNGSNAGYENKLFVGGLSWQTTPEKLREYFTGYGTVTDVLVMKDPVTQRSRGFGFITFSDPGSVLKVLAVPMHTLDGKKIDPKHATPRSKSGVAVTSKTNKVFVGGVSQDTTTDEVRAYFSQFGKVEETVMLMDQQTKRHRGFGFVTFKSEDVVDQICEIHFHTIKTKKVECKKAQPKEAVTGLNALVKRVALPLAATTLATQVGVGGVTMVPAVAAAAAANYSKLVGTSINYPTLASYRYSPYPMPLGGTPNSLSLSVTNPFGSYALPTPAVDISALQNLDWSSVYNAY